MREFEPDKTYVDIKDDFYCGKEEDGRLRFFQNPDLVIALGSGWSRNIFPQNSEQSRPWELLSAESFLIALSAAAVALQKSNEIKSMESYIGGCQEMNRRGVKVILSGGYTKKGYPTEADAMYRAIEEVFPEILYDDHIQFIDEDVSEHKDQMMRGISHIVTGIEARCESTNGKIQSTTLVTVGQNVEWAKRASKKHDLTFEKFVSAEECVGRFANIDSQFAEIFQSTKFRSTNDKSLLSQLRSVHPQDALRVLREMINSSIRV